MINEEPLTEECLEEQFEDDQEDEYTIKKEEPHIYILARQNLQSYNNYVVEKINEFFPKRTNDNKPDYREFQFETIKKIIDSFVLKGKKFVAVDGPVGCGKSAINYTVARIIGSTVYLTPQKQLQDQIIREKWDGVRMIKGRNAYVCNHSSKYPDDKIRCDYHKDDRSHCNNSKSLFKIYDLENIKDSIKNIINCCGDDDYQLKLRSAFDSNENIDEELEKINQFCTITNSDGIVKNASTDIGCRMSKRECAYRCSKIRTVMAPVKILNPDIFFMLNSYVHLFKENEMMVIDECHAIENVIQRLFSFEIPIDTLKEVFGVNLECLWGCEPGNFVNQYNAIYENYLGPILCVSRIISRLGDVCSVHDDDSFIKMKSSNMYAEELRINYRDAFSDGLSMIKILNYAFTGNEVDDEDYLYVNGFIKMIREDFIKLCEKEECCESFDIMDTLIPAAIKYYSNSNTKTEMAYCSHISIIKKMMTPIVEKLHKMVFVKNGEYESFVAGYQIDKAKLICKRNGILAYIPDYYSDYDTARYMSIVPLATNAYLRMFFYTFANKILLTSGTWVDPNGTFNILGINKNEIEFIKIPSTFKRENRPIYVLSDEEYTDFSQKNDSMKFVYKTEDGIKKFNNELEHVIEKVRTYIENKHGCNPNIVVHCHTFDIARMIARYYPSINNKFLIHIGKDDKEIINNYNKSIIQYQHKELLLQKLRDNPDSGTILVSSSVSEGVDLKDGITRVQIILKRPIPSIVDPYVNARWKGCPSLGIKPDDNFLDRIVYTTMIQQYGRVVRSKEDWGYTIIMDQAIAKTLFYILLQRNEKRVSDLNIRYFIEGIQGGRGSKGTPFFYWHFEEKTE